jgi:hypothetical protein
LHETLPVVPKEVHVARNNCERPEITVENGFPESVRFHIVPLPNQYTGNWKVEI